MHRHDAAAVVDEALDAGDAAVVRIDLPHDVAEQADQTFRNIKAAMEKAGFALADVVRCTYILPNGADFEPCWPVFKKYFGDVRPACTAVVSGLVDPRMKIEIEVTAKKR